MFDNIGGKFKKIVWRSFQIKCIVSGIIGIVLIFAVPLLGLLLGPLAAAALIALAYMSSIKLYGLGQLIENTDILAGRIQPEHSLGNLQPTTKVVVTCKGCGFQFPERPKVTEPCPQCGSTVHAYAYPTGDDTAATTDRSL